MFGGPSTTFVYSFELGTGLVYFLFFFLCFDWNFYYYVVCYGYVWEKDDIFVGVCCSFCAFRCKKNSIDIVRPVSQHCVLRGLFHERFFDLIPFMNVTEAFVSCKTVVVDSKWFVFFSIRIYVIMYINMSRTLALESNWNNIGDPI